MKRTGLRDSLIVLALSIILIWPLFRLKYLDDWRSIESTFIADARITADHLPHTGWQPLWYCGTRFDYVYPPALRYGPALLSKAAHLTTARAYHLYTAILYVLGILAVYWFVRVVAGSWTGGLFAAAGVALLSPSMLLIRQFRWDNPLWFPQRLHVLMRYGEGPHMSALAILPAALAASYLALKEWRPAALAAAGALCALVVMHNFYGATALAIFFPVLVWSVWVCHRGAAIWLRAACIAVLAYGLCATWLTWSYVSITLTNMRWVSEPGSPVLQAALLILLLVYGVLSFRLGRGSPELVSAVFVTGSLLILGLDVLSYYYFNARIFGEGHRLAPELDLVIILAGVEVIRRLWLRPPLRTACVAVVVLAFVPALYYLPNVWKPFPRLGSVESGYPWKFAKWVHDNLPGERTLPSGEIRFWFDVWDDNIQADGGSKQGMLNQIIPIATYQIQNAVNVEASVLWLQSLGAGAVIVPGPNSPDDYHADYKFAQKFRGVLPVIHEEMDTAIYRVPRIYSSIGRVVDRTAMSAVGTVVYSDVEPLRRYVAVIERPQPETFVDWNGFDQVSLRAKVSEGQSVLLQETYDPQWKAWEGVRQIPLRREPVMGFMLMDVPPGDHLLTLKFETPPQNQAGFALFGLTVLVLTGLLSSRWWPRSHNSRS